MRRLVLLFAAFLFVVPIVLADKKESSPTTTALQCPIPDALPLLPAPDKRHNAIQPLPALGQRVRAVMLSTGIDVSHHNGRINWQQVANEGTVHFAYIKATESASFIDSHFADNLRDARQHGIPAGVYHFFHPSIGATQQFAHFEQTLRGVQMDLIPVVDVEKRGRASLPQFQKQLRDFLVLMEKRFGVKPIIYTGQNFYNKYLAGKFTDYKFFMAKYDETQPTPIDNVQLVLWQFTCKAQVPGVRGDVDRSCFMGSFTVKDLLLPLSSASIYTPSVITPRD